MSDQTLSEENNTKAEFIGQVVSIFEIYAEENNLNIPSEWRDIDIEGLIRMGVYDTPEEAIEGECLARIYGEVYDEIGYAIEHCIFLRVDADKFADDVYDTFVSVASKKEDVQISDEDKASLKDKVRKAFVDANIVE